MSSLRAPPAGTVFAAFVTAADLPFAGFPAAGRAVFADFVAADLEPAGFAAAALARFFGGAFALFGGFPSAGPSAAMGGTLAVGSGSLSSCRVRPASTHASATASSETSSATAPAPPSPAARTTRLPTMTPSASSPTALT